ncbi:MAG: sugar transferase [Ancrocorticia sp.]|jgi:lipopolysaccharide/colanic/teichoic acid biosynthesis glycosyltransferase|nr:sugar transferase [Ancrocorticia sp.]
MAEQSYYVTNPEATHKIPSYSLEYRFVKRAFDIVFSLVVIIAGLIPSLILAAIIMIDSPGAPIFRQRRIGQHGRETSVLKFRTMHRDAHTCPEKYFTPEQLETWSREQKVDNDPRITRVGGFLRKTSLDELPQFINVFLGSMSVVGCRPVTYEETLNFGSNRDLFLALRPGITGWWQVTERNDATWENGRRQEIELYYPHNASARFDLSIIGRTIVAMLTKTGK